MTDSPLKKIAADVKLGKDVIIYDFVNLYGCEIGDGTKIASFVEIQKNAKIGRNCKISSHTFICEEVTLEDGVFVGHNVTFINDKFPKATGAEGRLKTQEEWKCLPTYVAANASIGSGAVIMGGIRIGQNALIGAGSVVTKDVPDNAVAYGNPARIQKG